MNYFDRDDFRGAADVFLCTATFCNAAFRFLFAAVPPGKPLLRIFASDRPTSPALTATVNRCI